MYQAKIICDSFNLTRLTTFEITFPRIVLSEFNTHRMLSRNSASSRAIPVQKQIQKVLDDPFIPIYWGKNQAGMQADHEISLELQEEAIKDWLRGRDYAVEEARRNLKRGIHKQIINRGLEKWGWQTCIVTATEWSNFFALRTGEGAQPEIRTIALMMQKLYNESEPKNLGWYEWHLPYVTDEEVEEALDRGFSPPEISAARSARVSYLTQNGIRDMQEDQNLYKRLVEPGHLSPLEHPAQPASGWHGNFDGWKQLRKFIPNEADFGRARDEILD